MVKEDGVLKNSILSGTWMTASNLAQKLLGFVSFFILARLLKPEDFGVVAIIFLVPKIIQSATELGFATAVVQRDGDITAFLNPIWTINVVKGLLITILIFIAAPLIGAFVNAQHLVSVIGWGGLLILIQNLANPGEIFFSKNLDFKKISIRNIIRETSYMIIAIFFAFNLRSYWALIIATFASQVIQTVSTYFLHPYRPRLTMAFGKLRNLLHYSKWVVGQGWLDQAYNFLEQTTVARYTNLTNIGFYSKAKNIASVPTGFLNPVISLVSFSAYAKIKNEPDKVRDGFIKSLDIIFFFLIPITILILYAGGTLILILLGPTWLPMTQALRILLIFYLVGSFNDMSNTLINALGYPQKEVLYNSVKIIVTIILLLPLTLWAGISGAALAVLAGALPTLVLNILAVKRYTRLTLRMLTSPGFVPLLSSLLVAAPFMIAKEFFLSLPPMWLLFSGGVAALLYGGQTILWGALFNKGPFKTVQTIIKHSL